LFTSPNGRKSVETKIFLGLETFKGLIFSALS